MPSAIGSVWLSARTPSSLSLSWNPLPCEEVNGRHLRFSYKIVGSTRSTSSLATKAKMIGLRPCTVYYFQLRAVNDVGPGPRSTTAARTLAQG